MKVGRRKKANRVLTFYRYRFGYLPPYSVLMDGTFYQAALQFQLNLQEQLPKYLSAEVNILTTKCVIHELEELGGELRGALAVAKEYGIAKCPHKPLRSAVECLKHLARRSKQPDHPKYFIGTQDDALLESVREMGGVPLMSIRFNTILLEKPTEKSITATETASSAEIEKVRQMKAEVLGEPKKRKKGPKAPNPLSCKKKKPKNPQPEAPKPIAADDGVAKRKRVRKRKLKSANTGGADGSDGPSAKRRADTDE